MAEEARRKSAAGSLSESDDSASSLGVSCFLQSLTDRQLQVMQEGMSVELTRDEIAHMIGNIVKIVSTISRKAIVPKLGEFFNVDPGSLFLASRGSSRHSLQSVTKDVAKALVKTICDSLDEKEDSQMLDLLSDVTEKIELLESTHGSVELLHSSPPLEPSTEKLNELTSEEHKELQQYANEAILEIYSIYQAEELRRGSETDLSDSPKTSVTVRDLVDCLLSELDDMKTSSQSSSTSDDISSDSASSESDSLAGKALKRTQSVLRIPSLVKLSSMTLKMENQEEPETGAIPDTNKVETSILGQTLSNASLYAQMFVDELLFQMELFTKSEVSENAQSELRQCSPDASVTAELLVDRILAYMQEVSATHSGDSIPAVPLDFQTPSCLQSFQKIQSEDTRTRAAQKVSEILLKSSQSFTVSSLHSLRAHTSQTHSSVFQDVEPTLSKCSATALALVDSVIDGIREQLHSSTSSEGSKETQSEHLDGKKSGSDVSEENLWSTANTIYRSTMSQLRDFSAMHQQRPATVDPPEIDVGETVDPMLLAIKGQLALSKDEHSSEKPQLTCYLIRSMDKRPLDPDRSCHLVSPEHTVSLPGTPTPSSKGEGKKSHLLRSSVRITDKQEGPKSRERVSISTLVDTMMTLLGLQGSGHSVSLKELSAVTKRVDDLFSTAATQELAEMVQLILTDRLSSLNILNPDLHQYFAIELLGEFADESAKRLLMSCIAPRPASASTEYIPSLVMPFRVTPKSFEISRPPSEVYADTIDLFSKVIVKTVMEKVSAPSDHEEDAVVSEAEETPDIDPHSSETLNPSPPTISVAALHHCLCVILHKVQEMSSTGVHGYPLLIDDDQVQKITDAVKEILALFTAVSVADGEHALKKLHRSIIDAVYAELVERIRSERELIEAVRAQSQLLMGSLAVSIVRAIKNADPKDLYRPPSGQSGSCPSVSSQIDMLLASQSLLKSDREDHASLVTLLVLRVLAQLAASSSDLRKEASSNDPKELIERILLDFSTSSGPAKLDGVLSGTFAELLQRFREEGPLHKILNSQDSTFDEALMTALRKRLEPEAPTACPETDGAKNVNTKKRKSIFFHLKMPKINIFKKRSKKGNNAGSSDQDCLQSRCTADTSGSSSATSRKEKRWRTSIFTRMVSYFRKQAASFPL